MVVGEEKEKEPWNLAILAGTEQNVCRKDKFRLLSSKNWSFFSLKNGYILLLCEVQFICYS